MGSEELLFCRGFGEGRPLGVFLLMGQLRVDCVQLLSASPRARIFPAI